MVITLHGQSFGDPSGQLHFGFTPFDAKDIFETKQADGTVKTYPARLHEWKVIAPEGSKLGNDFTGPAEEIKLCWPLKGELVLSNAQEVNAFAESQINGFSFAFKPGDRVCLKSGGPAMTVESFEEDEYDRLRVYVVFFKLNAKGINARKPPPGSGDARKPPLGSGQGVR